MEKSNEFPVKWYVSKISVSHYASPKNARTILRGMHGGQRYKNGGLMRILGYTSFPAGKNAKKSAKCKDSSNAAFQHLPRMIAQQPHGSEKLIRRFAAPFCGGDHA